MFWGWARVQAFVLVTATFGWYCIRTYQYLRQPDDLEVVTHTWRFQLTLFLLFVAPWFPAVLFWLLGAEWLAVRWFQRRRAARLLPG